MYIELEPVLDKPRVVAVGKHATSFRGSNYDPAMIGDRLANLPRGRDQFALRV